MEEKEDPDDVITTEYGYYTTSTKSTLLDLKKYVEESIEVRINELTSLLENVSNNDKKSIKKIFKTRTEIMSFAELLYIINNINDYEKYLWNVLQILYKLNDEELSLFQVKQAERKLNRILPHQTKKTTI